MSRKSVQRFYDNDMRKKQRLGRLLKKIIVHLIHLFGTVGGPGLLLLPNGEKCRTK
jgi:hypothetical protein